MGATICPCPNTISTDWPSDYTSWLDPRATVEGWRALCIIQVIDEKEVDEELEESDVKPSRINPIALWVGIVAGAVLLTAAMVAVNVYTNRRLKEGSYDLKVALFQAWLFRK